MVIPGVPLHITQRGVNRCQTFDVDLDLAFYRWALGEAILETGCMVHAYALMTNHVHLLVTPPQEDSAALLMRSVGCRYVRYYNDLHGRTGTLWEGRFRSSIVADTNYFFTCSRYIELNPVRAGLVAEPREYAWSSFDHNACGIRDPLISEHQMYLALGASRASRAVVYRAMFATGLTDAVIAALRASRHGRSRDGPSARQLVIDAILSGSEVTDGRDALGGQIV